MVRRLPLEPVSVHCGRRAPKPARVVNWWKWRDGVETSDEFWSCANFALSLITPNRQDEPVLDRIAEIGVVADRPWDPSAFSDEVAEAIRAGMDDTLSDLMVAADEPGARQPIHVCRAEMDRDYFGRAVRALRCVP